jgi:phytoene dehydrogenase-like protein
MDDALRAYGLREDQPLAGLLSMLIEDTVHSSLDQAPLVNAALGITIRGVGLTRPWGGMRGFWRRFVAHYRKLGGVLKVGCKVERIESCKVGSTGGFHIKTQRGDFQASQVVGAIPAPLIRRIAPTPVGEALQPYLRRDDQSVGGALAVFLGVPEEEVSDQAFRHHQLLQDYANPLGNGNNMFISVSAPGDTESAPSGYRAVMITTHCDLEPWEGLTPEAYQTRKWAIGEQLISLARRVYPDLGKSVWSALPERSDQRPVVYEVGTPRTYERFTHRPRGAVGGVRQTLRNTNQRAIPHDLGIPGFWLAGDTTWPGLGTVACILGSRIVAEGVMAYARRLS